ncbi:ROK family protein [Candidatus Giovannonibacteria bacterium]|nr:ROK family protein [Candidatus Giovannonibacteria bacterium]
MIIGLDIGGSKIRGIFWNGKKILRFLETNTPKNKADFIKKFKILVSSLAVHKKVERVGIAAAGIILGNRILSSPNIKYLKNFDFTALLLNKPLKVDNDARAFLRSETWRLSRHVRTRGKILGFTIGTGVGRAYGEKGMIKKIKAFEYPERWEKEYQRIRNVKDYNELAEFLARKLGPIITKYKPNVVVFGGGIMDKRGFFRKLEKKLHVKCYKSCLGRKAGALGAAMLWKN